MSDEYTPTLDEVREAYVDHEAVSDHLGPFYRARFDRALAEHDAEVARKARAEALREAAGAYRSGVRIDSIPKWLDDLAHDIDTEGGRA